MKQPDKMTWLMWGIALISMLISPLSHFSVTDSSSTASSSQTMPTFNDIAPALEMDIVPRARQNSPYLADYDSDGLLDILFTWHGKNLFRQHLPSQVVETTEEAGLNPTGDLHGAAWGDCDNDGQLDLYQTRGAGGGQAEGPNRLYHNLGDGTFAEITADAGVTDPRGRGRTASWIDYDNDGDLDLFVANWKDTDSSSQLFSNNGDCTFSNVSDLIGELGSAFHRGISWADYDNDGDMDLFAAPGALSALYRNNGDGTFSNVTQSAGITSLNFTKGMTWGDYDNDGDMDLFVTRTYGSMVDGLITSTHALSTTGIIAQREPDEDGLDFYTNAPSVDFTLGFPAYFYCTPSHRAQIHVGPSGDSPGACVFSLASGNIGEPPYEPKVDRGLYIWQSAPTAWHVRWSAPERGSPNKYLGLIEASLPITDVSMIEQEVPNRGIKNLLYRNKGDGTFEEVGQSAGVDHNKNAQDAIWLDFNNDGHLDLYVINAGDSHLGNQENFLYLNQGDGTFQDVATSVGAAGANKGLGNTGAVGDFNADGFPDMLVTNSLHYAPFNGAHQLLLNQGNDNHWLQIKLEGQQSNSLGIGARVELTTPDGMTQIREMNGGSRNQSQDEMLLSFGLGQHELVSEITIHWPSGITQELTLLTVDQRLTVLEPDLAPTRHIKITQESSPVVDQADEESIQETLIYEEFDHEYIPLDSDSALGQQKIYLPLLSN